MKFSPKPCIIFSLIVALLAQGTALAKGKDVFTFSNGNTVSYILDEKQKERATYNTSAVAVFQGDTQRSSRHYYLSSSRELTKLYHGSYVLFQDKPDGFLPVTIFAAMNLMILDSSGAEKGFRLGDAAFTGAREIPGTSDRIALVGTRGNLYHVGLAKGEVVETLQISSSALQFKNISDRRYVIEDGTLAMHKVHILGEDMKVKKTLDVGQLIGYKPTATSGPSGVIPFANGAFAFLHDSGRMVYVSPADEEKALAVDPAYRLSTGLKPLPGDRMIMLSDDYSLHVLDKDGHLQTFDSGVVEKIAQEKAQQSSAEPAPAAKSAQTDVEITNTETGCIAYYLARIGKMQSSNRKSTGMLVAVSILNPVVGIGGMIMTKVVANNSSSQYRAFMMAKLLDDAERGVLSPDIEAMAKALMAFDGKRYRSPDDVVRALRAMNASKSACTYKGEPASYSTIDIAYQLAK